MSLKAAASSWEHPIFVVWAAVLSVHLAFEFGRSELKSCSRFPVAGNKDPISSRGNLTVIQYSQGGQQRYENIGVISSSACSCRPKVNAVCCRAEYVHVVIRL